MVISSTLYRLIGLRYVYMTFEGERYMVYLHSFSYAILFNRDRFGRPIYDWKSTDIFWQEFVVFPVRCGFLGSPVDKDRLNGSNFGADLILQLW